LIPIPMTIFSAMFMHGGLLHVGGNMLYLWIFGNNIEDVMGHIRFFIFYLICGVAASLAHIVMETGSRIPMIGASGAVAGILGAYILLFPKARILCLMFLFYFIRLIYVPALVVLGFWFILQVFYAGVVGAQGGVAWFAHIGGFITGFILIKLFRKKDDVGYYEIVE